MARMTSAGRVRAFVVMAAAGGYALALPPFDHAGLAWLTLVPLLLVVRTGSPRRAFTCGALYGFAAGWIPASRRKWGASTLAADGTSITRSQARQPTTRSS